MIAVALKGLLGRKTRAILTALAIVLGTGMVSATFIFTDTLNQRLQRRLLDARTSRHPSSCPGSRS